MSVTSQPPAWAAIPEERMKDYREWIGENTQASGRDRWNSLDIGGGVKMKVKNKDFSPNDVKSTRAVFTDARTAIGIASMQVAGAAESWSADIKARVSRCFFIEPGALTESHAQTIRTVIASAKAGLNLPVSLKLVDNADGTRASVPQSSEAFVEERQVAVKQGWIKHAGPDKATTIYAAGIRFDSTYLQGALSGGQPGPGKRLRAKTLIHEATHRFANTKDHAYFADDGAHLEAKPAPPDSSQTELWLDNADSYGWFCITALT